MKRLPIIATVLISLACASCMGDGDAADPSPSRAPTTRKSPSPAPSESPTATTQPEAEDDLPPLTPFGPELTARLHAIRDKVSEIRELPVVADLAQEGVVRAEDLKQSTVDQFAALEPEDQADAETSFMVLRMLRLAPQDYAIEEYAEDYAGDIAGFYSFKEKALVLVGEPNQEISLLDEFILAHEYTHSLQDAAFDLQSFEERWADTQQDKDGLSSYSETVRCLIEGDATLTQITYAEEVFGSDWRTQIQAESEDEPDQESELPEFLQNALYFDYNECYSFAAQLYEEGGWDAVNAAFEHPPATTEQVLDISKYYDGELANGLMPADLTQSSLAGWTASEIGQFGMFDIYNYIVTLTEDDFSGYIAAIGWGSGWLRMYDSGAGGESVLQFYLSFDSDDDLEEFIESFGDVLEAYGADSDILESEGIRHFEIAGNPTYYSSMRTPDSPLAFEILVATSSVALAQAEA